MRFRSNAARLPKVLFIVHAWGGGTIRLATELADLISDRATVVWAWGENDQTFHISTRRPYDAEQSFDLTDGLRGPVRRLRSFGFCRANIIHTVGLKRHIVPLMSALRTPYDVTFSDYHHFSERPHFEDEDGFFIGDDRVSEQQAILTKNVSPLLTEADRLIAISGDLSQRVRGFVPDKPVLPARVYEANSIDATPIRPPQLNAGEPLRLLNLGRPHPAKGLGVIVDVAQRIDRSGLPVEIYCLGESIPVMDARLHPFRCVKLLGAYDHDKLPAIVEEIRPHLAWFPFTQPETHSYALSDVLRLGLPVLATGIGAIPERLVGRPLTWLVPYAPSMAGTHFEWIEKLYRTNLECAPAWVNIDHLPAVDEDFFPEAYLAPILEGRERSASRLWGLDRLLRRSLVR